MGTELFKEVRKRNLAKSKKEAEKASRDKKKKARPAEEGASHSKTWKRTVSNGLAQGFST